MKKWIALTIVWAIVLGTALPAYALQWEHVPWVSEKILNNGSDGGEMSQWPQGLAIDSEDGQFAIMVTDVGGIIRSLDGGKTWESSNIGLNSRGGSAIAIDPNNKNRVLLVGGNSGPHPDHGLFLSEDQGRTWRNVLKAEISGFRDVRDQLAYDEGSFDESEGHSMVAYWLRVSDEQQQWGNVTEEPGLYKTTDGGETWSKLSGTDTFGNGSVKVHPADGHVFIQNGSGIFRSTDGGQSFTQVVTGLVTGFDLVNGKLFYLSGQDVFVSEDGGDEFEKVNTTKYPVLFDYGTGGQYGIKVSPANTDHMLTTVSDGAYGFDKYYSKDGGVTWHKSKLDNTNSFMPFNGRPSLFAWHPTDERIALSIGGDYLTRTDNAGETFAWSNSGNPGIMAGALFNFNVHDPDLLFVGSQDYAGAFTTDGGITWQYTNVQDFEWGGWTYGTYIVNPKLMFGASPHWDMAMAKTIHVSRDGGKSFTRYTDKIVTGLETSYGDPHNDSILFCYEYRSTDQGYTWTKMDGADGVFTHNFDPDGSKELYGAKGNKVVVSYDQGETWEEVFTAGAAIKDVAYDWQNGNVYAAAGDGLYRYDGSEVVDLRDRTPKDQYGSSRYWSVAIDPKQPQIVYAAGPANTYNATVSTIRSTDAGETWDNLTIHPEGNSVVAGGPDGGREAWGIRVHPETGYAYVGSVCYGFWRIAPPYGESQSAEAKPLKGLAGHGQLSLQWFGNGRDTLLDVADLASKAIAYPGGEVPIPIRLQDDLDGNRQINAIDLMIRTDRLFGQQDRPLDRFEVYRSTAADGEFEQVAGPVTETAYIDTDVENGTTYYYKVKNLDNGQMTRVIPVTPSGEGPGHLFATAFDDRIELMWTPMSGTYDVVRRLAESEGEFEVIAESLSASSYVDADVEPGVAYEYAVRSNGAAGGSSLSEIYTAMTRLSLPPKLTSVNGGNLAWNKAAVASGEERFAEPSRAVDGQLINGSKWSDAGSGDKWLTLDLGMAYKVDRWVVKHASEGGEDPALNTSDFKLQVSDDGLTWTDADSVTGNTYGVTDRDIQETDGRYFRLAVTKPTQSGEGPATIYELELYGPELVSFAEAFDAGTIPGGWQPSGDGIAASNSALATGSGAWETAIYTHGTLTRQFAFGADVRRPIEGGAGKSMLLFNYVDRDHYYALEIMADQVQIARVFDGKTTILQSAAYGHPSSATVRYEIRLNEGSLQVQATKDGVVSTVLETAVGQKLVSGFVGVGSSEAGSQFDNVALGTLDVPEMEHYSEDLSDQTAQDWTLNGLLIHGDGFFKGDWGLDNIAVYNGAVLPEEFEYKVLNRHGGQGAEQYSKFVFNYFDANNYDILEVSMTRMNLKRMRDGAIMELAPGLTINHSEWLEFKYIITRSNGKLSVKSEYGGAITTHFENIADNSGAGGKIGLGVRYAASDFDNISVDRLQAAMPLLDDYSENFDDGTADGWNLGGMNVNPGGHMKGNDNVAAAFYEDAVLPGAYTYSVLNRHGGQADANKSKIYFNYKDDNNYYVLEINVGKLKLKKKVGGVETELGSVVDTGYNEWWSVVYDIENNGTIITVTGTLDGNPANAKALFTNIPADGSLQGGKIGIGVEYSGADFDQVSVRQMND